MKSTRISILIAGLFALVPCALAPQALAAQEVSQPVVYATYYECNPLQLARLDSLIRTFWGPITDRYVKNGKATAWGWLGHHTGGTWERAFYIVSPDVNSVMDANDESFADGLKENREAARQATEACPEHEDYIWQRVVGSQAPAQVATARPAAGLSIYYECDQSREDRTDAIVATSFEPTLKRLVQSGDLTNWNWFQHLVGGKYRRMLVTDGKDAKTLLAAIGKLTDELSAQQPEAYREFNEICSSHQDMLWSILITKP